MANERPYLIDVSRLIWRRWAGLKPTGIDRVCLAYLRHYGARAQAVVQRDECFWTFNPASSDRLFNALLGSGRGVRRAIVTSIAGGILRGNAAPGDRRFYFNLGHTGLERSGLSRWVGRTGVRPIFMVHDLIPLTHPQYCRADEDTKHERRMRTVLQTAHGVIGNSRATLDSLGEFAQSKDLPVPPTLPAWLGIDEFAFDVANQDIVVGPPTFIVIGTIEGRKNHGLLLDVWDRLAVRKLDEMPRLLIIGQRGWANDAVLKRLDSLSADGSVVEIGPCDDEQLISHMQNARALLFPSHVEGYGLPLVEALAAGTPVIASDLPVFREISQGVPDFIAPDDAEAWEAAILDYARRGSGTLLAQRKRLVGFHPPTWEEHFRLVDDWLAGL